LFNTVSSSVVNVWIQIDEHCVNVSGKLSQSASGSVVNYQTQSQVKL